MRKRRRERYGGVETERDRETKRESVGDTERETVQGEGQIERDRGKIHNGEETEGERKEETWWKL